MVRLFSMIAVVLAFCLVCSSDALAKGGKKGGGHGKVGFKQLDKNNDGKVSKEEFTSVAKDKDRAGKVFAKADKNGDGFLSEQEFKAMEEARKDHQKKK